MTKFRKRLGSVAVAGALCFGMVGTLPASFAVSAEDTDSSDVIFQAECEDLKTKEGNSPQIWTDIYGQELPGYSGEGFVYLTGDTLEFTVDAPEEGMYEIKVNYAQILSTDGREQTICVNDTDYMIKFPYADSFCELNLGRFRLQEGENVIQLKPQYGYACFDTITISKAASVDLDVTSYGGGGLCDPDATAEAQSLMSYLESIYGSHVISGQQEIYGGGNDGDYDLEFNYLKDLTGDYPAIRGFDFMNYNPLYGWDDNTTERCIEWVTEKNGIATASWHINVPSDFASYEIGDSLDWTSCTYGVSSDFDTANAVIEGTKEYEYVELAIADLAEQLLRLQDAGVPIILRPFHEAEGNGGLDGSGSWFWWSKAGVEVYKQLWIQLYTDLTEKYGLHNIIWEENLYDWSTDSAKWYVGDAYVDIVGYDKYNTEYRRYDGKTSGPNEDAESSRFYNLVSYTGGKKMVAMAENDTIPSLSNLLTEEAGWLYFCPWYGDHILSSEKNDPDTVKELYQSDYCITLSELPSDLYTNTDVPKVTTTAKTTEETEETTTTEAVVIDYGIPGDLDGNSVVNGFDLALARQELLETPDAALSAEELAVRDLNGDESFTLADVIAMIQFLIGA